MKKYCISVHDRFTRMKPALAAANIVTIHSLQLVAHIPTLSPLLAPKVFSPAATLSLCISLMTFLSLIDEMLF